MSNGKLVSQSSQAAAQDIANLVYRYARYIRSGNSVEAAALFRTDAVFETRQGWRGSAGETIGRLEGRDAIAVFLKASVEKAPLCPVVSNLEIDVTHDRAESICLLRSYILGTAHVVFAEYRDSYAFDGMTWRFTALSVSMLVPPNAS